MFLYMVLVIWYAVPHKGIVIISSNKLEFLDLFIDYAHGNN